MRFCTQRPSRPDRSLFAWASSLADDAAVGILREAVKATVRFDPHVHMTLGKLGRGVGGIARAVCAQRCFAGDKRKQLGGACGGDPERTGMCVRVRLQGHLVALRILLRAREDARAAMEMARGGAGSAVGC